MRASRLGWSLPLLVAGLLLFVLLSSKGPLQDVHWDAPIYLKNARAYAETPYLREFSAHSDEITDHLRTFKADQGESTPYWGFIRLGHIVLLGTVTSAFGASVDTIRIASWAYTALLMAGLVGAVLLCLEWSRALRAPLGRSAVVAGAFLSAALYAASDVTRHLAGNFVAEVPALVLLAAGLLALLAAVRRRSAWLAVASGALAFALYVVKMDAIWPYVTFAALLLAATVVWRDLGLWWPAIAAAALTAAALYIGYAWWFWPLPDPRLIVVFERAHDEVARNSIFPMKLWVVAGGLLWTGVLLALCFTWRTRAFWFAFAWLVLFFLPYTPSALESRPMQTRMFALAMLPLMMLSTLGWSMFVTRWQQRSVPRLASWGLAAIVLVGVALSHEEPYNMLRQQPGMWRLQYVKEWLSPPRYERLSYPLADIEDLTRFALASPVPLVLVIDRPKNWEIFSIIAFLLPRSTGESLNPSAPPSETLCGRPAALQRQRIVFCEAPPTPEELAALSGSARVFLLQRRDPDATATEDDDSRVVHRSGELSLVALDSGGPL